MVDPATASPARAPRPRPHLARGDWLVPTCVAGAMAGGLGLGCLVPQRGTALNRVQVDRTSLPFAIGLLVMEYPALAQVRYGDRGSVVRDGRLLVSSLILTGVVGPQAMLLLAGAFLGADPACRTGLILVGPARCIAVVLIWNDLACGDGTAAAVMVARNSSFPVVAPAVWDYFSLEVLPGGWGGRRPRCPWRRA